MNVPSLKQPSAFLPLAMSLAALAMVLGHAAICSGQSVSGAGDVNGDGLAELVVGAYGADPGGNESAGESSVGPSPCPWDCGNNDGEVGIVDLLALLGDWGNASACDFDGGGVGITDFLTLLGNWGPCPGPAACGPGSGTCCAANGTPGCEDERCCATVCAVDSYCCDVDWDGSCAAQAQALCSCPKGACGPGQGSCCMANDTPGCEDVICCEAVCEVDPFCCDVEWDGLCASEAQRLCGCP